MQLPDSWLNPPRQFSLMPFWFWNDDLDEAEIVRQMADFEARGVCGGVRAPEVSLARGSGGKGKGMNIAAKAPKWKEEGMSNVSFRLMSLTFNIIDLFMPHIDKRVETFGIREGMTVVDYGCGPGRYAIRFARLAGASAKVYAVDIQPLAIETIKGKMAKEHLQNISPFLAAGYNSGVPDHVADVVCAIDMFFGIKRPTEFLAELKRITKVDGTLIIDDGHQARDVTKAKILESGYWIISAETPDHLTCTPSP